MAASIGGAHGTKGNHWALDSRSWEQGSPGTEARRLEGQVLSGDASPSSSREPHGAEPTPQRSRVPDSRAGVSDTAFGTENGLKRAEIVTNYPWGQHRALPEVTLRKTASRKEGAPASSSSSLPGSPRCQLLTAESWQVKRRVLTLEPRNGLRQQLNGQQEGGETRWPHVPC